MRDDGWFGVTGDGATGLALALEHGAGAAGVTAGADRLGRSG